MNRYAANNARSSQRLSFEREPLTLGQRIWKKAERPLLGFGAACIAASVLIGVFNQSAEGHLALDTGKTLFTTKTPVKYTAGSGRAIPDEFIYRVTGRESGDYAHAFNKESKACGVTQLIPSTQLHLMSEHAEDLGVEDLARHIRKVRFKDEDDKTRVVYQVAPGMKKAVMGVCKDPEFSINAAKLYHQNNLPRLQAALGRRLNFTDGYFAHFLGHGGAATFLKAYDSDKKSRQPAINFVAGNVLRHRSNRILFFRDPDKRTGAYTVAQVYEKEAARMGKDELPDFLGQEDGPRRSWSMSFARWIEKITP